MKLRLWVLLLAAVACIGGCALWSSNPIHRNEAGIRVWLLQKAPLGSSVYDVEAMLAREGWKAKLHWTENPKHPLSPKDLKLSETFYPGVKGVEIIGADIGYYRAPWEVWIDAFWGFDSSGKLIDLNVRKGVDAL